MNLELEKQFDDLATEDAAALVEIARERGGKRQCFLCGWIAKKIKKDEFPIKARKVHLVLDCLPILKARRNEAN